MNGTAQTLTQHNRPSLHGGRVLRLDRRQLAQSTQAERAASAEDQWLRLAVWSITRAVIEPAATGAGVRA